MYKFNYIICNIVIICMYLCHMIYPHYRLYFNMYDVYTIIYVVWLKASSQLPNTPFYKKSGLFH